MTTITAQQYESLKLIIYNMLMGNPEMGLGDMGDCMTASEMAVDEWMEKEGLKIKESRLQPPYYQPVLTEQEMIQHDFYSFQVYGSLDNVKRDFPNHEIKEYFGDDIESPTFVDDPNSFA